MRKSRVETAETRRRIVETASREFRRNGIHATGLADLMAAAGLTHGGFYRHFDSKDQLVAEACAAGMADVVEAMEAAAAEGDGRGNFRAIVERYLLTDHKEDSSNGCPLAGLGSELARADPDSRDAATAGFVKLVDAIAGQIRRRKPEVARSDAMFALVAMIGALTMSRIVTDPELAASILRETEGRLCNI